VTHVNCIKQDVKDTFLLVIQVFKASKNKGEIGEVQSNQMNMNKSKKKLVFKNSGTSWNRIWKPKLDS
jgi:hypothetical protein